jgi:ABC-type nickel/cobalt efflux system permease component RcnA
VDPSSSLLNDAMCLGLLFTLFCFIGIGLWIATFAHAINRYGRKLQ